MVKNNNKKSKKLLKTTAKTIRYIAGGSVIAFVGCICIGSVFYLKINHHKKDLQQLFNFETNLNIDYDNIKTGFTWWGSPYLHLENLTIFDNKNNKFIKIKNINLTLSYSTLWHFQPVFSSIQLDNSDFIFELDSNNDIKLNKHTLFNLDDKNSLDFNFSKWFTLQKNVSINRINLEFIDSKHNILPIIVNNIQLSLNHDGDYQNNLIVDARLRKSKINSQIQCNGNDIFNYKSWQVGEVNIHNIGNKGYLIDAVSEIQNGEIQYIKGTLDSNKNIFTSYSNSYGNVENFYGSFLLNRLEAHKFKLQASHLTLDTEFGYLFHNATIDGNIDTENGGSLDINNLSLNGVNSIIKYFVKEQGLEFSGDINTVNLKWYGDIKDPKNINLNTKFSNIALKSNINNIPSFNNLSGIINTQKNHGNIQLELKNSTINSPLLLHKSVLLSQLSSSFNWQLESANKVKLSWDNSILKTPDFTLTTNGQYDFAESNLKATINLQKLNFATLYKYLPAKIDKLVAKDIQQNLKGSVNNTIISIDGNPRKLPFTNGGGKLTINGTVNNASYMYLNGWPEMHNVNGKINGLNQKISFTSNSGSIGNLPVAKGNMTVADISAKSPQLVATGEMNNQTSEYINFILNTTLKDTISQPASQFNVSGSSFAKVNMTIPLNNPEKVTLKGTYNIDNNTVSLKNNESMSLSNLTGVINFNQNGVTNGKLSAKAFDSDVDITIPNAENIEAYLPNLNYSNIVSQINPKLTAIVSGSAATTVDFNINDQKLIINSNLESVVINAPNPLYKAESTSAPLIATLDLKDNINNLYLKYNNLLFVNAQFESDYEINSAKINIGQENLDSESDISEPKIVIKSQLNNTYLNEWIPFAQRAAEIFTSQENHPKQKQAVNEESENILIQNNQSTPPILIDWSSNSFWMKNYNFGNGNAKFYIYPSFIQGKFTSPNIEGKVAYTLSDNHVDINLNRLILSRSNIYIPTKVENNISERYTEIGESTVYIESSSIIESQIDNTTESTAQTKDLKINNINESNSAINIEDKFHDETSKIKIPNINFYIKDLYLDNYYWGTLKGSIIQQHDDLYLNNVTLKNNSAFSRINVITHCMSCTQKENKYVAFNIHSDVKNFGNMMLKADQGDMFNGGNGTIDVSAIWPGGVNDFDFNNLEAYANLNLKDGVVVKIKPGLFGALMGVINFSAINITNINHFNFNSFFGQSFAYKSMSTKLYLNNSDLHIDELELSGDVADISSFGNYYIESRTLDTYLTVEPKIAGTVATTAGIVTLNPIIGALIYVAQKLIGDPINKAFAISYHVTGDVNNPQLTQTEISKQIIKNFKSSMNLLNNDD